LPRTFDDPRGLLLLCSCWQRSAALDIACLRRERTGSVGSQITEPAIWGSDLLSAASAFWDAQAPNADLAVPDPIRFRTYCRQRGLQ